MWPLFTLQLKAVNIYYLVIMNYHTYRRVNTVYVFYALSVLTHNYPHSFQSLFILLHFLFDFHLYMVVVG